MARTYRYERAALKKGAWSPEEDQKLIAYIKRYGIWNWSEMPKPAGLARSGKSCRLRWMNYLRPNIKRGSFSKEEEDTILNLHNALGNRWSTIATKLPGRTDNEIKNYWHTRLKKRMNGNMVPETKIEAEKTSNSEATHKNIPEASNLLLLPSASKQPHLDTESNEKVSMMEDYDVASEMETCGGVQSFWDETFWMEDMYKVDEEDYDYSLAIYGEPDIWVNLVDLGASNSSWFGFDA